MSHWRGGFQIDFADAAPWLIASLVVYTLITGLLHGLLSIIGLLIGQRIKSWITKIFCSVLRDDLSGNEVVELKAAKIGAYATLCIGFISAISNIAVAFIK